MKDMRINFSDTTRDFSAWMREKCGNVVLQLCLAIREKPEIIEISNFKSSLDEALKVFALCNGNLNGIHCELVYMLLLNYNVEGYSFMVDLIHNTKNGSIMKRIFKLEPEEKIMKLIEENNHLNRTRIAELLVESNHLNEWIQQIADDIEEVHNGNKKWGWFYSKHCNDRKEFQPQFDDKFIQEVYDYFHSDIYMDADDCCC